MSDSLPTQRIAIPLASIKTVELRQRSLARAIGTGFLALYGPLAGALLLFLLVRPF